MKLFLDTADVSVIKDMVPTGLVDGVTTNPSLESLERFIREGERATWPRMEMIRNQMVISQTLANCMTHLKSQHSVNPRQPNAPTAPADARRPSLRVVRSK